MTATHGNGPGGDLGELLATEERLEQRLAEAQAEAARLLAAAEEAARRRDASLDEELDREGRRLEADAEALRARRLQDVESEARAQIERFGAVPDARVAELAREVVALVAGGTPP